MKHGDDLAGVASLVGAGVVVVAAWAEAYVVAAIIGVASLAVAAYLLSRNL